MTEMAFAQRWAGESRRLPYWEAGVGETIVAILDGQRLPRHDRGDLRQPESDDPHVWLAGEVLTPPVGG